MSDFRLEFQRYNEIRPFFDELLARGDLADARMSSFWRKNLAQRHNFPTFNEILTFRRGLASAIGYSFKLDEETEYVTFRRMFGRARALAPLDYLTANQESGVGTPYQYCKDGILSSSAGIENVANAYRIETVLQEYPVTPAQHCILEIGAGYGGVAEALIRRLNPATYVVCDLPHNLFLSAFYLSVNYPERSLCFVNENAPETIPPNSLVFATPTGLERIQERFTLAVNTFSFQEMPIAEVHRYFAYVRDHLDGLFYFLNHHRVAEGAQKPGDYPFDQFAVKAWRPMPCPQQHFFGARQAYEVIMQPGSGASLPPYFDAVTHTLSLLLFMAVNTHLTAVCERLVRGAVPDKERAYLAGLHEVITSSSVNAAHERLASLSSPAEWLPVTHYVSGLLRFFGKDVPGAQDDFRRALDAGLTGFARTRALVFLALTDVGERSAYLKQAVENTPQFEADLEAGRMSLDQFKLAYLYAFPRLRLHRTLIPRRLRRLVMRQ
jgi:putative sugar O-methyltransferase